MMPEWVSAGKHTCDDVARAALELASDFKPETESDSSEEDSCDDAGWEGSGKDAHDVRASASWPSRVFGLRPLTSASSPDSTDDGASQAGGDERWHDGAVWLAPRRLSCALMYQAFGQPGNAGGCPFRVRRFLHSELSRMGRNMHGVSFASVQFGARILCCVALSVLPLGCMSHSSA